MELSNAARKYIEGRGWIKELYEPLKVFSDGDRVCFPITDYRGEVVGCISRSIVEKSYIVRMIKKSWGHFLWTGPDSDRVLFLVEGVFDVGWLLQHGFHAAAYLGNALNPAQLRVVARFYENVVMVPDSDPEGQRGAEQTVAKLRRMGVTNVQVFPLKEFKDISECFEGKLGKLLLEYLHKIEDSMIKS